MTFLAEILDLKREKNALVKPTINALAQSLSCLCGIIFPFCHDVTTWSIVMTVSMVTYLNMFPRCYARFVNLKNFVRDEQTCSFSTNETKHRIKYSFLLLKTCTTLWTVLVVFYFINMLVHRMLPVGHPLRYDSLAMSVDTLFDVVAKIFYMVLILEIHETVFDEERRAERVILELQQLMSVLWESSCDAIIVSIQHSSGKHSSMLSPSFLKLIKESMPGDIRNNFPAGIMIEFSIEGIVEAARYVDSSFVPYNGNVDGAVILDVPHTNKLITEASSLIKIAWDTPHDASQLVLHHFNQKDGGRCTCEVKTSYHSDAVRVVVLRDVTERFRRQDAERRAHSETLARQRDAQAINRFTRHEVKNGLLATMEMCDNLRSTLARVIASIVNRMQGQGLMSEEERNMVMKVLTDQLQAAMSESMTIHIEELDSTLRYVLNTVLADAMARDVIHQVYQPKLERLDVEAFFVNQLCEKEEPQRYHFHMENTPTHLMMDSQLLQFIHRNAISNACKYGKLGGQVITTIDFDMPTSTFFLRVINEPGYGHEAIVKSGTAAREAVFAEGSRLGIHQDQDDKLISSGHGAWIISKCAQVLGGSCSIDFEPDRTVFLFQCPAMVASKQSCETTVHHEDFCLPPGTLGIAIDDSKVQRRLMDRILLHAGVEESHRIILGKEPNDIFQLGNTVSEMLKQHPPPARVLLLVDENLDYSGTDSNQLLISGSRAVQDVLSSLSSIDEARVLALIRSADDSAEDVTCYASRAHGFFPKVQVQKENVQEALMPIWFERFGSQQHEHAVIEDVSVPEDQTE